MICEESSTGIIGIPEREIRENEEEAIFEDNGRDFWKKIMKTGYRFTIP